MRGVCELINGRAYNKTELLEDGKYRVLRVGNFFTNNHWYWSDLELEPNKYCESGDLLYAWSASFGPRIWREEKCIYHYHIWKVRPFEDEVTRDFLYYFFEWDKERIRDEQGAGATMVHVSKQSMEARDIPLPPLDEQKRIVAKLDQAFAALDRARANAEANLMDVSELEMRWTLEFLSGLDGASRSLESVCDIYQPKTIATQAMIPDGRYVVFGANGKIGRYNEYNHADSEVLVTCRGATCGRVNVSEPFSWVTGNAMVVRPKTDELRKDFLEEILRSSVDWSEVITGAAQPQITRASLSPVEVLIPDVRVQEEAVGKMKTLRFHVSKLREMSQAKIANIAALRQSLLHAAFSGQLS